MVTPPLAPVPSLRAPNTKVLLGTVSIVLKNVIFCDARRAAAAVYAVGATDMFLLVWTDGDYVCI